MSIYLRILYVMALRFSWDINKEMDMFSVMVATRTYSKMSMVNLEDIKSANELIRRYAV